MSILCKQTRQPPPHTSPLGFELDYSALGTKGYFLIAMITHLTKSIEVITNVAIIVVAVLLTVTIGKQYFSHELPTQSVGSGPSETAALRSC